MSDCPAGTEEQFGKCYTDCAPNFIGDLSMCRGKCPPNFDDWPTYCTKPSSYGRGWGHTSSTYCEQSSDHGAKENGCEKCGALYYPKCDNNYSPSGCNICEPVCPNGYTSTYDTCIRPIYSRGPGVPASSPSAGVEHFSNNNKNYFWIILVIIVIIVIIYFWKKKNV